MATTALNYTLRHVFLLNIQYFESKTPEWFKKTVLPWLLDIEPESVNPSRVFRELEAIENRKEKICLHLFERIRLRDPKSMESVFYDLSSTTFSGSRCVIMKWGHCKEGFKNHVVLAIVVNREGLPFYWEVLPGGTADATTIAWLLERLKDRFENIDTTLVFDRGMVSEENLAMLEESGIKYISAMDRNQIETLAGLDFSAFSHFDPEKIERQSSTRSAWQAGNRSSQIGSRHTEALVNRSPPPLYPVGRH